MANLSNLNEPLNITLARGSSESMIFTFDAPFSLAGITPEAYAYNRNRPSEKFDLDWAKISDQELRITFPVSLTTTFPHASGNWVILLKYSESDIDCLTQGQLTLQGPLP